MSNSKPGGAKSNNKQKQHQPFKQSGAKSQPQPPKPQPQPPKPPAGFAYVKTEVLVPLPKPPRPRFHKPRPVNSITYVTNIYQAQGTGPSQPSRQPAPHQVVTPQPRMTRPPTTVIRPVQPIRQPQNNMKPSGTWVPTTPENAASLSQRAVVGGYEGWDGSPLWVIRSQQGTDLVPGKLAVKHKVAYIPYNSQEVSVQNIEVLCDAGQVCWVPSSNGSIPPSAIVGGKTAIGEPLYIGRAMHNKSLTPGKVHILHGCCYISFGGKQIASTTYEMLCKM